MKIWKIAQEDLYTEVEELDDRVRVYLKRRDGQSGKDGKDYVGKLTIQYQAWDENGDMVTAFNIDPEYRGSGWGRKMMEEALKHQKRSWYVSPEPYGGNIGSDEYNNEIDRLHKMYGKFGWKEYQDNIMVRKKI